VRTGSNHVIPDETESFIRIYSRFKNRDPAHAEHVAHLAVQLFDQLIQFHHLDSLSRKRLLFAALLHDIGLSAVDSLERHHTISRDIILKTQFPGLDEPSRTVVAHVSRYHRRKIPDAERHRKFAALSSGMRNEIEWLAGILRVADGLDRSHSRLVHNVRCEILKNDLIITLESIHPPVDEIPAAQKKSDLLVQKTGRKLSFREL
jgi:exopolyphosphatase / guanosine-5'-triphosphate,3'-diphosphate pyrophosphatase